MVLRVGRSKPLPFWIRRTNKPRKAKVIYERTHERNKELRERDGRDLWMRDYSGEGYRYYLCHACECSSCELAIEGVPLRCAQCGTSFLEHPGLQISWPRFEEPRPGDPIDPFGEELY